MIEPSESPEAWQHCLAVIRPVLLLAPRTFLADLQERLAADGIQAAIARHDTAALFDWIVRLLARQGISNHSADVFLERNGSPTFANIAALLATEARCPRLRCWWSFSECAYRRSTSTCGTPHHRLGCPVALIPARKGTLSEAAVGLWLFIRDVCGGDLVGWIDDRLATADPGADAAGRAAVMRAALLEPLTNIPGTGPKIWAMILAELLLGADLQRERWVITGASFVAVDSLVHALLHRTGILHRLGSDHSYGPACYESGGCAGVITALAERIDAREFNPAFPRTFPRWVQFSFWLFCAADGLSICNALMIDDAVGCTQRFCPVFPACDQRPIP